MRSCPSDRALRLLTSEESDSVIFDAIEEHIARCAGCRARLESLAWKCPIFEAPAHPVLTESGELPEIPGFAIEKELGRGSIGAVYLARDQMVGRQVALKVMQATQGADESRGNDGATKRRRSRSSATRMSWSFMTLENGTRGIISSLSTFPAERSRTVRLVRWSRAQRLD